MTVKAGMVVTTNYGTGPYVITDVSDVCTCTEYLDYIDGNHKPSEPHFHLTCVDLHDRNNTSWLNGHRSDGTSVWSGDRLEFHGMATGVTGDLFG